MVSGTSENPEETWVGLYPCATSSIFTISARVTKSEGLNFPPEFETIPFKAALSTYQHRLPMFEFTSEK